MKIKEKKMKVLVVHTHYQQPGGEDTVFASECEALRRHGVDVHVYEASNHELDQMNGLQKVIVTFKNNKACGSFRDKVKEVRPDVVHFHNTFPLLSPEIYREAKRLGLPTVKTLHNFRLFCTNGLLFRNGRPCEDCLTLNTRLPGVLHRCYRNSFAASAVCAGTMATHEVIGTWAHCLDRYIALTEFGRNKFVKSGLPADKVVVKPNFIADPGIVSPCAPRAGALCVGRLVEEKGIRVLLDAWRMVGTKVPLDIIGEGPLSQWVAQEITQIPGVRWLGARPRSEVLARMKSAMFLAFPSLLYEGFPMTIVEAYGCGLPVITSDLGSMSSIILQGQTGLKFPPGDASALAQAVLKTSVDTWAQLGQGARKEYEAKYTESINVQQLLDIYREAMAVSTSCCKTE